MLAALLGIAVFLPLSTQALALEREGAGEKICTCDFTSALLKISGKQGERFALSAESDGIVEVHAPAEASAGVPARIFLSIACNAPEGSKLFEITATSLAGGEVQKKLFSLKAVQCPKLAITHLATTASCPSEARFEFELENKGLVAEKGVFSAGAVPGYYEFSPNAFSLEPGEKILVTLSVSVPQHLLSTPNSENLEVKAVGRQSQASVSVALVVPLCPSPAPTQFPGGPSPTPLRLQAGLGSVSGENFLTGFTVAGGRDFSNWLSGLNKEEIVVPRGELPYVAAALLIALLVVAGYALHKERQAKEEEKRLAAKRRQRMQRFRAEI